jgi:hypothetical protein
MRVSQFLMLPAVVLLAIACDRDATPDSTFQQSNELSAQAPVPTSGAAGESQPAQAPPAPRTDKKAPAPATPVADQAKVTGVNADAAVLQDFTRRIDAYMKLRKDAVKGAPALKETTDAAKIKASQDAMAVQIRAARADAKHGDIFTSEITAKFRRLLSPELKGEDGRDAKAVIKDDAPTNVPFKVNAKYPDGAPVPTVPANLLLNLPTLPEPLQFRIIDRHLILLDEDADVILDYALNVIR